MAMAMRMTRSSLLSSLAQFSDFSRPSHRKLPRLHAMIQIDPKLCASGILDVLGPQSTNT